MQHQNWTPQIITKFRPKVNKPPVKNNNGQPPKTKTLDIDDNPKTKKIDKKMCQLIREKRLAMGFNSQKDLAKKLNINSNDIKCCETVGSIYKPQVLAKIKRCLQINKNNS